MTNMYFVKLTIMINMFRASRTIIARQHSSLVFGGCITIRFLTAPADFCRCMSAPADFCRCMSAPADFCRCLSAPADFCRRRQISAGATPACFAHRKYHASRSLLPRKLAFNNLVAQKYSINPSLQHSSLSDYHDPNNSNYHNNHNDRNNLKNYELKL